jgi:hypothetical protein
MATISEDLLTECAPCADSEFSLKDKKFALDDMALVESNKCETYPTDDEESLESSYSRVQNKQLISN